MIYCEAQLLPTDSLSIVGQQSLATGAHSLLPLGDVGFGCCAQVLHQCGRRLGRDRAAPGHDLLVLVGYEVSPHAPALHFGDSPSLDEAIAKVNATPFGLATGLFTKRLDSAFEAARRLVVGGVHINETPSSRVDVMPYGGSKDSGFGREGPSYSIKEMSEERMVTILA